MGSPASNPTAWLITDGKIGDAIPLLGVAAAMGLCPQRRVIAPSALFAALAPWGPADPRDAARTLRPPYPAIAFAAGRRTVPYLRALKRRSPTTFTAFFGDPRTKESCADLLWAAAHDGLAGPNTIASLTTPHTRTAAALDAARDRPDGRVAVLPSPLAVILLGGPSRRYAFSAQDAAALADAAQVFRNAGYSLAVTPSRRTPHAVIAAFHDALRNDPDVFVWEGQGENPYPTMLALADTILVTTDSSNMVSEAVATAAPVHLFAPSGSHPRLESLATALISLGRARRWAGRVETWPVVPIDATPVVAAAIAKRYAAFQQALT